MPNTQFKKRDPNGILYCDPSKTAYTVRFKSTSSKKILNGHSVENVASEIIVNDSNEVVLGSDTGVDALSVRLRVSGSTLSHERLKAIIATLASQVDTWGTENVFIGFEPTTPPVTVV